MSLPEHEQESPTSHPEVPPQIPVVAPTVTSLRIVLKGGSEYIGRFINPRVTAHEGKLLDFTYDEASPALPFLDRSSIALISSI